MRNDNPVVDGKPFTIIFDTDNFNKGDVIGNNKMYFKVIKAYKEPIWRRFFRWMGFNYPKYTFTKVKVEKS